MPCSSQSRTVAPWLSTWSSISSYYTPSMAGSVQRRPAGPNVEFPISGRLHFRSERIACSRYGAATARAPWNGGHVALELRPNCEFCDRDLAPHATDARICTYECTFCSDCVDTQLQNVCPNCGGGFTPRPIRPATEWRAGLSIAKRPPSSQRRSLNYDLADIQALTARVRNIPPEKR